MNCFAMMVSRIVGWAMVIIATTLAAGVHAAGTITLGNTTLTRMNIPTTVPMFLGVFWGTNPNELMLVPTLGSNSTVVAGLIVAPNPFFIPGTDAGQMVYMQIRAWSVAYGLDWMAARANSAYYGETDVRLITLGPEAGPGTIIWQSTSGTNPSRFYPLVLGAPSPAYVNFGLSSPNRVVDEGQGGVIEMTLTLFRFSTSVSGSLDFSTTVQLQTIDQTAIAGQDYVGTNGVVTFAPGELTRPFRIYITPDAAPETNEQFLVSATGFGVQSTLAITIRPMSLTSVRLEPNQVIVNFPTTDHQHYALESSTDLTAWAIVPGAENLSGTGGEVQVVDVTPDCCGHRFYRMRLVP